MIVVAPKNSGIKRARSLAEYLESAIAIVDYEDDDKNRENGYVIGNVSGKKVILIDDILNTGVTFANAANVVREAGASEIYAVASHGLFTSGAADVLEKADIPVDLKFVADQKNDRHYFLTVSKKMTVDTLVSKLKQIANRMSVIKDGTRTLS